MSKKEQVEQMTRYMANFVSYVGKKLPTMWRRSLASWPSRRTARCPR